MLIIKNHPQLRDYFDHACLDFEKNGVRVEAEGCAHRLQIWITFQGKTYEVSCQEGSLSPTEFSALFDEEEFKKIVLSDIENILSLALEEGALEPDCIKVLQRVVND